MCLSRTETGAGEVVWRGEGARLEGAMGLMGRMRAKQLFRMTARFLDRTLPGNRVKARGELGRGGTHFPLQL